MSSIKETAERFFEACETGKGWQECQQYCHEGATFSAQAKALADVSTLEGHTDWMKGLLVPVPDGSYEVKSFAIDEQRQNVTAFAIFRGTLLALMLPATELAFDATEWQRPFYGLAGSAALLVLLGLYALHDRRASQRLLSARPLTT